MHRCVFAVALALTVVAAPAQMARQFPVSALRGELVVTQPPEVLLNGRPAVLAPGSRIRGEDNLMLLSASLVGQKRTVHYTLEPTSGHLMDVWLLRPEEIANKPWPTTPAQALAWRFDAGAQKWTRP